MEGNKESSASCENGVYQFYTVEDAMNHTRQGNTWSSILVNFTEFIGKTWMGTKRAGDKLEFRNYKIVGIEDNSVWHDYYWILEDENHNKVYKLANDPHFKDYIID